MALIFDIEADSLLEEATRIHCIVAHSTISGETYAYWDGLASSVAGESYRYERAGTVADGVHLLQALWDDLVGHNIYGYDLPLINKLHGIDLSSKGKCTDLFTYSSMMFPDIKGGHSLEAWAERLSLETKKVANEDWSVLTPQMIHRCHGDVKITMALYEHFASLVKNDRKGGVDWLPAATLENRVAWVHAHQVLHGVRFDVMKAVALVKELDEKITTLEVEAQKHLPSVVVQPYSTEVKSPFKKDGTLSKATLDWFGAEPTDTVAGPFSRITIRPVNLDSRVELKNLLLSLGWQPTEYTEKGSPKITEELVGLEGTELGKIMSELNVLKHRRRFLLSEKKNGEKTGALTKVRKDGRVPAEAMTCATPTSRYRHSGAVCNIPRVSTPYGKEIRSLYCVPSDRWQIGADLSGIEARMMCHYAFPYPKGPKLAQLVLEGDFHCYSGDTELLTPAGWVRFDALTEGVEVAQFDITNHSISFVQPLSHTKEGGCREMLLHPKSRMLVTAGHKHYLKGVGRPDQVVKERDVSYGNGSTRFVTAGYLTKGLREDPDLLRLVVACQADGSRRKSGTFTFEFVKQRKIERFRELFAKFGFSESITKRGTTLFRIKEQRLCRYLDENKEFVERNLYALDVESIRIVVDEVVFWDGTENKGGSCILDTTSEKTAEVIHTLCSLCGRKSRYSFYKKRSFFGDKEYHTSIHRVVVSKEKPYVSILVDKPEKVDWNQHVYCVGVPSGFLLTRRDGFIVVSGNSHNATLWDVSRNDAKTGLYALMYGCGDSTLAKYLGKPMNQGKKLKQLFWDGNPALSALINDLEKAYDQRGGWLVGPDGRKIFIREKRKLLNSLLQHSATIVFKKWLIKVYEEVATPDQMIAYHDEGQWEFDGSKEDAEWTGQWICKLATEVGKEMNLNVPIAAEYKVGKNWSDCH
jgi:DNA polymerase I